MKVKVMVLMIDGGDELLRARSDATAEICPQHHDAATSMTMMRLKMCYLRAVCLVRAIVDDFDDGFDQSC